MADGKYPQLSIPAQIYAECPPGILDTLVLLGIPRNCVFGFKPFELVVVWQRTEGTYFYIKLTLQQVR